MLVDSHCHLNFPDFKEDLDEVLVRAQNADVKVLQTICTKLTEFPDVLSLTENHDSIYCSIGIHPHHVSDEPRFEPDAIVGIANRYPSIIGIGETGLDYYYENSPREAQRESFCAHIDVARKTGLPVIIHSRSADEDTASMLRAEHEKAPFPGVIHCFTAGRSVAEAALECGLSISLSGIVTFKNAHSLRNIIQDLPVDKLLIETDAPFLSPVPRRGVRNEPSFVSHTAEFIADLLAIETEQFADQSSDNFFALFTRARRPS